MFTSRSQWQFATLSICFATSECWARWSTQRPAFHTSQPLVRTDHLHYRSPSHRLRTHQARPHPISTAGCIPSQIRCKAGATKNRLEINRLLSSVPVFTVTDTAANVFSTADEDGDTVCFLFLSYQPARELESKLAEQYGDSNLQIVPLKLSNLYFPLLVDEESNSGEYYSLIPSEEDADAARQLLEGRPNLPDFHAGNGAAPLFAAQGMALEVEDSMVTPLYFSRSDLLEQYNKLVANQPLGSPLPADPKVLVTDLQTVVEKMMSDTPEELATMRFVPSQREQQAAQGLVKAAESQLFPSEKGEDQNSRMANIMSDANSS